MRAVVNYIWYNAEFGKWKFNKFPPNKILAVGGWKKYCYYAMPDVPGITWKNSHEFTHSPTGLTEYIYIGELW